MDSLPEPYAEKFARTVWEGQKDVTSLLSMGAVFGLFSGYYY